MQDYHFNISGKIIIDGDSTGMEIYPENIINLIRIYDYRNRNMPAAMIRLNLDRNLLDKIIKNAKTAVMHLRIGKFVKASDDTSPLSDSVYIEDDFSIIVDSDINYNKELDYADSGSSSVPARDRYKQIYLGLISKACLDANKIMENIIIQDTPMQSIVLSYLTHTHLLIEPFDYNEEQSQLIIPPSDTLSSLIAFLASIKTFYNTRYLFFIDEPRCTYLISRSGTGIEMKGEAYNQVNISLKKGTDPNGFSIGMGIDMINKSYTVDVSVLDSMYTINHDTAKVVNEINVIVNPSNDNNQEKNKDIVNIKNEINNLKDSFMNTLNKGTKALGNIETKILRFSTNVNGEIKDKMKDLEDFQGKLIDATLDHAFAMPVAVPVQISKHVKIKVPIMQNAIKKEAKKFMMKHFNVAGVARKAAEKLASKLTKLSKKMVPSSYNIDYSDNHIKCLSYINLQDTIKQTLGKTSLLPSGVSGVMGDFSSGVLSKLDKVSSFTSKIESVTSKAQKLKKILQKVQKLSYYGKLAAQHPGVADHLQKVIDNVGKMDQCVKEINTSVKSLKSNLEGFSNNAKNIGDIAGTVKNVSQALSKIPNLNVKSRFISAATNIKQFKDLDSILQHTTCFPTSVKTGLKDINFSNLKSLTLGTLTYNDIVNIKDNLNVYDIDKIGQLGLNSFASSLNVGGDSKGKQGSVILKVRNDNPNEIKNIKSELETMVNQLTINKFGLDPSVFTPNKKYVVTNYDGHNAKNGDFILNGKTEVYIREDNTFVCNTKLDLSKLPSLINTDKIKETSKGNE